MRQHFFEGGTVWACHKGGNSEAEQARANQVSEQQLATQQQQLGLQQQQLGSVNATVDPMIAQGGMSPAQEAALTSLALNQSGQALNNSIGAIGRNLQARGVTGGPFAGGGTAAQNYGNLYAMQNALTQNSLSNIQLQKAAQLQGLLGLKLGIGSQYGNNAASTGNQGVNALNAGVTAAGNADQAQSSFMGSLMGALTSPFQIAAKLPCSVARLVYGENNPVWMMARDSFYTKSLHSVKYAVLWNIYRRYHVGIAAIVKRSDVLMRLAKKFFDGLIYG